MNVIPHNRGLHLNAFFYFSQEQTDEMKQHVYETAYCVTGLLDYFYKQD